MKKIIKIKFVDFWEHWDENNNFIVNALKQHFTVVISNSPDYIFYSNFNKRCEHLDYNDTVKIFYTQENLCPDFNFCDYGIGFERLTFGDRYITFPICFIEERYGEAWRRMCLKQDVIQNNPTSFIERDFCSFVVSNKDADEVRDCVFEELCKYKKVQSGGRYKNNIGLPNGVPDKLEFAATCKFSLCFENSSHPGYYTEKLVEGFAANTVPIYWGDPCIGEVFNEKAFINLTNCNSVNEMVEKIIEVDQNDELYMQMLLEPALINEKVNIWENKQKEFSDFLVHIFDQEYCSAYRRNRVFWGERYYHLYKKMRNWYVVFFHNRFEERIIKILKSIKRRLKGKKR